MSDPLVTNAADPAQVNAAADEQKSEREQLLEDVRTVLAGRAGRRLLWRYLSIAGVYKSSFADTAERTAFNEGQRSIGLTIISDVTASKPDAFVQMMLEAKAEAEMRQKVAAAQAENESKED